MCGAGGRLSPSPAGVQQAPPARQPHPSPMLHGSPHNIFQTSVLFVQQCPPWLQQFKAQGATPGNVFIYVQCRSDNCSTYLVVNFLEIFQMSHVYVYKVMNMWLYRQIYKWTAHNYWIYSHVYCIPGYIAKSYIHDQYKPIIEVHEAKLSLPARKSSSIIMSSFTPSFDFPSHFPSPSKLLLCSTVLL